MQEPETWAPVPPLPLAGRVDESFLGERGRLWEPGELLLQPRVHALCFIFLLGAGAPRALPGCGLCAPTSAGASEPESRTTEEPHKEEPRLHS